VWELRTLVPRSSEQSSRHVVTLGHVPALDGLRGIAILLVLGVHAGGLIPAGFYGVDLFFVLSGFLITSLLLGEWAREGAISLLGFYRRRALRLLPALFSMLAITLTIALASGDASAPRSVAYGATYTTNIVRATGGYVDRPWAHLWSLAAEEQFYLLWPPLLLLLLVRRVSPRWIILGLGASALASTSLRMLLFLQGHESYRYYFGPDAHATPILLGCIAGIAVTYRMLVNVPALATTASLVIAPLLLTQGQVSLIGLDVTVFALASALVISRCVLHPQWWFARVVVNRPLRYLGRISYGLYLWHFPLFLVLGWLGIPASLAVATLSYHVVERPFLRRRRRPSRRESVRVAPTAVPATVPSGH
jgi:peptidoglycan/LPS O-acetylase OafA/YrhL